MTTTTPTIPDEAGKAGLPAWTPGPWQAFSMEKHGLKGFVIDTALGNHADNAYVIADHVFGDQAEANARLIAAAPELYAQLEFAVKLLGPLICATAQIDAMKGALAKARGE